MKVKDLMSTDMICLEDTDPVSRAIQEMADSDMDEILVLKSRRLAGMVTASDIVKYAFYAHASPEGLALREIMNPRPVVVHEMESALAVFRKMIQANVKHVPVVRDGEPVGMVAFTSPGLSELLVAAEQNLGFDFDKSLLQVVVDRDFEDELTEYVREEYGTKAFRQARDNNGIETLKDNLREEFRKIYRAAKLSGAMHGEKSDPSRERSPFAKPLVFILDDDDATLALCEWNLKQRGFDVVAFNSPNAFLKRLRMEQPDVIVLDWVMPKKNGMEVLQEIRLIPNMRKVPIIMATSIDFPAEKAVACSACCVDEYLIKPVDYDEMAACIKKCALET